MGDKNTLGGHVAGKGGPPVVLIIVIAVSLLVAFVAVYNIGAGLAEQEYLAEEERRLAVAREDSLARAAERERLAEERRLAIALEDSLARAAEQERLAEERRLALVREAEEQRLAMEREDSLARARSRLKKSPPKAVSKVISPPAQQTVMPVRDPNHWVPAMNAAVDRVKGGAPVSELVGLHKKLLYAGDSEASYWRALTEKLRSAGMLYQGTGAMEKDNRGIVGYRRYRNLHAAYDRRGVVILENRMAIVPSARRESDGHNRWIYTIRFLDDGSTWRAWCNKNDKFTKRQQ